MAGIPSDDFAAQIEVLMHLCRRRAKLDVDEVILIHKTDLHAFLAVDLYRHLTTVNRRGVARFSRAHSRRAAAKVANFLPRRIRPVFLFLTQKLIRPSVASARST